MDACNKRRTAAGLLLELSEALFGGMSKRGGVGLLKYLLGGVKADCKISNRLANTARL